MTIERARTFAGYTRFDVWAEDMLMVSFNSYYDAVDFIHSMKGF